MPSFVNAYPIDQAQSVLYEQGMDLSNVFDTYPGVCVLPLAEDPPTDPVELAAYCPVVTLRLHAPYRTRKVVYRANKSSTPPVMPAPTDVGAFRFVGGNMVVHNVLRQDQLGFDWQVGTVYEYVELAPPIPSDGLVLGTIPWVWPAVADAVNSGQNNTPMQPMTGAAATAGTEVLLGKFVGDQIDPSSGAYTYQFPSFYPGTFFNYFLVNGGPPTIADPRE